jgi:hypothetical protein
MFLKAIITGLLVVLFGYLSSFLVRPFFKVDLPEICKTWNKNHVMEASLFVTGFLVSLFMTNFKPFKE